MKKAVYLFLILAIAFSSCSKDEVEPLQACDTQNVLVDLPWLAELIEEQEQFIIGQNFSFIGTGKLNQKRVFILQNCCPFCNTVAPVYDCNGEELGFLGSNDINFEDIENYEVIWKSSKNECAFSE